ncbi:hypothetical protein DTO96_102306 [Ephemeroptericola cinctiostellae]|uniref:4'-phosphopantetheinyl transferase domain-containing protein n=1 Tax=Ephemeroptericola cinctiostellae TaxID=2268024 RepID=A0A345DDW3_9BURK|nr:hypothetical protein [Ephemeroptericola cinctiostellae]AXF86551.1 hypothetical protein DTO96_102306 [Ephemeroptericola cinctiostellae]
MIEAYPYPPSVAFEPTAVAPWLCYVICPNTNRDEMRAHGRAALRQILGRDVLESKHGPTASNLQLSISYAGHLCLLGVSLGAAQFGIDLVQLAAFDDWSINELHDVAAVYLPQKPNNAVEFAQQWAIFEASNKALKRGIQENSTTPISRSWAVKGLPAGFIGSVVVVDNPLID